MLLGCYLPAVHEDLDQILLPGNTQIEYFQEHHCLASDQFHQYHSANQLYFLVRPNSLCIMLIWFHLEVNLLKAVLTDSPAIQKTKEIIIISKAFDSTLKRKSKFHLMMSKNNLWLDTSSR